MDSPAPNMCANLPLGPAEHASPGPTSNPKANHPAQLRPAGQSSSQATTPGMPDSSDLPPEACINALIQQLHETQAALLDAKLEASDNYREAEIWKGKYDSLEYQLTPNQQRAWFARLRYEELEAIHERAQEEVEKGKQARKTLKRKFDEMETECRHVKRQLTHTEAWAEEYKKLYENAEQQYVKELGKSDGSDEEIERLLVEKAKLIEELEQFWAETTRLRAERDELRSDLEGIMQDELPEIPYLRRQLAAAREEIEKLEKDLEETRTALTALENPFSFHPAPPP